ncbi:uncharacterized protein B0H18DRAFT_1021482, partial [Fomitopsis serialis]|uniref:uncharacterized protein n=1 Tax=Fomitopsis serialis TaxID=139415 RepID=UPI002008DFE4
MLFGPPSPSSLGGFLLFLELLLLFESLRVSLFPGLQRRPALLRLGFGCFFAAFSRASSRWLPPTSSCAYGPFAGGSRVIGCWQRCVRTRYGDTDRRGIFSVNRGVSGRRECVPLT